MIEAAMHGIMTTVVANMKHGGTASLFRMSCGPHFEKH